MKPMVPAVYMQNIIAFMEGQGISVDTLLHGTGVTQSMLQDPENRIKHALCHKILVKAFSQNTVPGYSLHYASLLKPAQHGFLGHAMMCARTVRESLKILERFAETRGFPLGYRLDEENGGAALDIELTIPVGNMRREYLEWGVTVALSIWSFDEQSDAPKPDLIELEYPEPDYTDVYQHFFDCPIKFGSARNAIHFGTSVLNRQLVNSNAAVRAFCEQRCELILSKFSSSGAMSDRVRTLLLNSPLPFPDAEGVARTLCISNRVLRRRLHEEETSFRALVMEVREHLARRYLSDATLTVEEVSRLLGYAEPPAFSRAFKKWTGLSPDPFRIKQQALKPEVA